MAKGKPAPKKLGNVKKISPPKSGGKSGYAQPAVKGGKAKGSC